jgi:hypothetical protein
VCTQESLYTLWQSLLGVSCGVTLGGNLPKRDAATLGTAFWSDVDQPFTPGSLDQFYASRWNSSYFESYKAFPDISGTYYLALDMSSSITLPFGNRASFPVTGWSESGQVGNATFTSKNEFVEIYVSLTTSQIGSDNGTVLSDLESNPYFWPASNCFVSHRVVVVAKPQGAYSQGLPPSLSTSRRTASGTNPYSSATRTFSIESLSPPYVFTQLSNSNPSYFYDSTNAIPRIATSGAWDYAINPNTSILDNSDWRVSPIGFGAVITSATTRDVSSSVVTYSHPSSVGNGEFQKTSWLSGDTVLYGTNTYVKFIQNLQTADIYWPIESASQNRGVLFNATYSQSSKCLRQEFAGTSATISLQVNT